MIKSFNLPLRLAEVEFTEKKSRFISSISPVSSEEEALAFLRSIREKHREASHHVYAYKVMETLGRVLCRHSDDGEPSGTAGAPLLDVFEKRGIFDFCCVATRYFGGVLLGAGGLVRAYSRCGALALDESGVGVMQEMAVCAVALPYSLYEPVKRLMAECGADTVSEDFGAEVAIEFLIAAGDLPKLKTKLREQSSGAVCIREIGTQLRAK